MKQTERQKKGPAALPRLSPIQLRSLAAGLFELYVTLVDRIKAHPSLPTNNPCGRPKIGRNLFNERVRE